MGIGFILIGVLFLFNPMINLLDILPDFIGYFFILLGIYKIADITGKMKNIHKHLLYLIGVSVFRTVLSFVINADDNVMKLIFVFVFAIIESVFMISVFGKIFDGFEDLGIQFENVSILNKLSEVKTLTIVFVIIRSLFTLIPEFRFLSMTDYEGEILSIEMTGRIDYGFILTLLNVVVVTLIGLVWLVMLISYIRRITTNSEFIAKLKQYYINSVLTDSKRFLLRRIMISMLLLMLGFVFLIDICIDNVDMLPDFVGAGLILAAVLLLRKDNNNNLLFYMAVLYPVVSLGDWIFHIIFAGNQYRVKHLQYTDVLVNYILLIAISLIAAAVLTFIFYNINKFFRRMINEMIGFDYEEHFTKLIERQNESIMKKNRANLINLILSALVAVSKIIQTSAILLLPEYWMIHFVIEIVWIFRMYLFTTNLYEEVKYSLGIGVE